MAISSRPISGRGISGDGEDAAEVLPARIHGRRWRTPVVRDRYPGIDPDAKPEAVVEPDPTPIYDGLSDTDKQAVDRLIVGFRMSKQLVGAA